MAGKKQSVHNYLINQYIKDALASLHPLRLSQLELTERFKSQRKTIYKESLDEKLWFLGQMGYRFALIFGPRKHRSDYKGLTVGNLQRTIGIFKRKMEGMQSTALNDLGIVVQADNEIMNMLSLLSSMFNSKLYQLVRDYEAIVANADNVYKSVIIEEQEAEILRENMFRTR